MLVTALIAVGALGVDAYINSSSSPQLPYRSVVDTVNGPVNIKFVEAGRGYEISTLEQEMNVPLASACAIASHLWVEDRNLVWETTVEDLTQLQQICVDSSPQTVIGNQPLQVELIAQVDKGKFINQSRQVLAPSSEGEWWVVPAEAGLLCGIPVGLLLIAAYLKGRIPNPAEVRSNR